MDEQVLKSLIKWPNVPDCYGWLALDRRGQWRMRNEFAQQNQLPGQVITNTLLKEYISRNYTTDGQGRFFFQNGPQKVFVDLDATPWIARIIPSNNELQFMTQCNSPIEPSAALSDESGNIYIAGYIRDTRLLETNESALIHKDLQSVALLHDHDLDHFCELATLHQSACSFAGSWIWNKSLLPIDPIHSNELVTQFHFIAKPSPRSGL